MRGKDWGQLLRRIPVSLHEEIVLATITGAEVVVKTIIELEDDYVVLRGRPAGSNDGGKIIIVPFQQLNFLTFKKSFTDEEVENLFGAGSGQDFAAEFEKLPKTNGQPAPEKPKPLSETKPAEINLPDEEDTPGPSKASKSMLLARIRERLASDSSKPRR